MIWFLFKIKNCFGNYKSNKMGTNIKFSFMELSAFLWQGWRSGIFGFG
jgi:hypothetical protein